MNMTAALIITVVSLAAAAPLSGTSCGPTPFPIGSDYQFTLRASTDSTTGPYLALSPNGNTATFVNTSNVFTASRFYLSGGNLVTSSSAPGSLVYISQATQPNRRFLFNTNGTDPTDDLYVVQTDSCTSLRLWITNVNITDPNVAEPWLLCVNRQGVEVVSYESVCGVCQRRVVE